MLTRFTQLLSKPKCVAVGQAQGQIDLEDSRLENSSFKLSRIEEKKIGQVQLTFMEKQPKKYERSLEEFTQSDQDQRNILHRAALEQNPKLIQDIIEEYQQVVIGETQQIQLKEYVNKKEKFGTTPLLMSCYLNNALSIFDQEINPRLECIKTLEQFGANVNACNERTLWQPVHWVAYYGDLQTLNFLIEKKARTFNTDYQGYYPIDLAGKKENKNIVEKLVIHLTQLLVDFERWKYFGQQTRNQERDQLIENYLVNFDRDLSNPILKFKLLFWSCYFQMPIDILKSIMSLKCCYSLAPVLHMHSMNSLHISAQKNNFEALSFILDENRKIRKDILKLSEERSTQQSVPPSLLVNNIFEFTSNELGIYSKTYQKQILQIHKWENNYLDYIKQKNQTLKQTISQINVIVNKRPTKKIINYYDQQDLFGNTALHLASIVDSKEMIEKLIIEGASMEIENKELWKPIDLTSDPQIIEIFDKNLTEQAVKQKMQQIKAFLLNFNIVVTKPVKNMPRGSVFFNEVFYELVSYFQYAQQFKNKEVLSEILMNLNKMCSDLVIPDYIIKCKLNSRSHQDPLLNRLNFQISLLQNAKFHIYLTASQYDTSYYYIMLKHSKEQLELQAIINKMEVKLIDSYDNEPFDISLKENFEPFRSRQRQDIIEQHIKRIINVEEQIDAGIFDSYYRMHSFGGISKIKNQWIEKTKWYWPQPLNQMDDYLLEGKDQNFTSCTILRLYFGEKISFFFAWKSYLTCVLLIVAIPGLALQIYIVITNDYNSILLPFWVIYQQLWATVIFEFWKRKTCEINARWGTLDMMNEDQELQIQEGFSGDEEIYLVTGELTKHEQRFQTIMVLLISIPILFVLTSLAIAIFFAIDYYNQLYAKDSQMQKLVVGLMNGASITILNIIYTKIAQWFVNKENHKYAKSYETSLIYKNVLFKFINSYLAIIYNAFFNPSTSLEELFYLLLPVLIIKQANYIFLSVLIPQMFYKHQESKYFKKVNENISRNHIYQEAQQSEKGYFDQIEQMWYTFTNKNLRCQPRAVLYIEPDPSGTPQAQPKPKKPVLTAQMDVDAVELNGMKLQADNNLVINYFMESMIDFGYITLFSAAFPIGPMISLLMNLLEIRMKIITYLYVYKKPSAERAPGIGDWLDIWEYMSFFGVFSNFTLLYFKQSDILRQYFFKDSTLITKQTIIWVYIVIILFLISVKYVIQKLIPDKPLWVQEDEEERKTLKKQKGANDDYIRAKTRENEELYLKINQLENEMKKNKRGVKSSKKKDQLGQLKQLNNLKSLSRKVNEQRKLQYSHLDRQLIMMRMKQIHCLLEEEIILCLCYECQIKQSETICEECDSYYCGKCFDIFHFDHKLFHQKKEIGLIKQKHNSIQGQGNEWIKLQHFCLPTYEKSHSFHLLQKGFEQLQYYYNGGNFNGFLELDELNLEDKLYMNRIMFLLYKRNDEIKWNDFYKQCKVLQNGNLEQKIVMLIEFMDENDDGQIQKKEFEKLIRLSFLQSQKVKKCI